MLKNNITCDFFLLLFLFLQIFSENLENFQIKHNTCYSSTNNFQIPVWLCWRDKVWGVDWESKIYKTFIQWLFKRKKLSKLKVKINRNVWEKREEKNPRKNQFRSTVSSSSRRFFLCREQDYIDYIILKRSVSKF